MTNELQTEREAFECECRAEARMGEGNIAHAVMFATKMLGPILLDIRDALQNIAESGRPPGGLG